MMRPSARHPTIDLPRARGAGTETPITPDDPEIPDEPPAPGDGEPEVPDQPLGPPDELDEDDAPLPGLPENEPPATE
jgi:hypothetical protein